MTRFKLQVHYDNRGEGEWIERQDITPNTFIHGINKRRINCAHIVDKDGEPFVYAWGNIHIPVSFLLKQEYAKI